MPPGPGRGDFSQSIRSDSASESFLKEDLDHECAEGALLPAVIGRTSCGGLIFTQALTVWRRLDDQGVIVS